jgi:hypothetical protein
VHRKLVRKGQFFILMAVVVCSLVFALWSAAAQLRRGPTLIYPTDLNYLLVNIKNEAKRVIEISLAEYSNPASNSAGLETVLSSNLNDWIGKTRIYLRDKGFEFHCTYTVIEDLRRGQDYIHNPAKSETEVSFTISIISPSARVTDEFVVRAGLYLKVIEGRLNRDSTVRIRVTWNEENGVPIAGCTISGTTSRADGTLTVTDNGDGTYTVSASSGMVKTVNAIDQHAIYVEAR